MPPDETATAGDAPTIIELSPDEARRISVAPSSVAAERRADKLLQVRGLSTHFFTPDGVVQAVDEVSFDVDYGETLGLVGESGSGKTTVGLTLMRLHEATAGEAIFEGRDILSMSQKEFMAYKRRIQIIFQNPYASLNPRFTVGHILTEPMDIHGIGSSAQERTELAFEFVKKRKIEIQLLIAGTIERPHRRARSAA